MLVLPENANNTPTLIPDLHMENICLQGLRTTKGSYQTARPRSLLSALLNSAPARENLSLVVYEQQRRRPAYTSAQSEQRLCYSLIGKYSI